MDADGLSGSLSVGLVTPGWPAERFPNGIATYVGNVAPALRSLGHEVSILAAEVAGEPPGGFPVHDVRDHWRRQARSGLLLDGALHRLAPRAAGRWFVRRSLADEARRMAVGRGIQVFDMEESFGAARWVQRATRRAVCVRLHGPWFLNGEALGVPRDREFRRRVAEEGRAIAEADGVTAPSRDVLERVRAYYGLPLESATVVPNPAAPVAPGDRWRAEEAEPGRILFVGRFDRHKGGDVVLEAFRRVLEGAPGSRLTFVGPDRGLRDEGGRTWSLPEFVQDRLPGALGDGRIEWLGHQPASALPALRRRASVTVACSRYENFPAAVVEALSAGCPVVAAAAGGIPEIVEDGVTGLTHRPGDAGHAAARILELLSRPGEAAALGREAAAFCERQLSPAAVAGRLVDAYRRAIASVAYSRGLPGERASQGKEST